MSTLRQEIAIRRLRSTQKTDPVTGVITLSELPPDVRLVIDQGCHVTLVPDPHSPVNGLLIVVRSEKPQ